MYHRDKKKARLGELMGERVQCVSTRLCVFQRVSLCVCMHVSGCMWEMGAKLPTTTFSVSLNDP